MKQLLKQGKYWFIISIFIMLFSCRSRQEQPKTEPEPTKTEVKENPKPGMEAQTDSLKRVLDEKRKQRN